MASEIPISARGVAVVVVRRARGEAQVLLLRRTRTLAGEWCQVAGKIEAGETIRRWFVEKEPPKHLEIVIAGKP